MLKPDWFLPVLVGGGENQKIIISLFAEYQELHVHAPALIFFFFFFSLVADRENKTFLFYLRSSCKNPFAENEAGLSILNF